MEEYKSLRDVGHKGFDPGDLGEIMAQDQGLGEEVRVRYAQNEEDDVMKVRPGQMKVAKMAISRGR
jgi:hypothetical protein